VWLASQRGHVLKGNQVSRSKTKQTDSLTNEIVTTAVFQLMLNVEFGIETFCILG
jgi:hypothetical protein